MASKHRLGDPYEYGDIGVDVKLRSEWEPSDVWWSPRGLHDGRGGFNSWVIVSDERGPFRTPKGQRVALVSVNGRGEIRWDVQSYRAQSIFRQVAEGKSPGGDDKESLMAIKHFKLSLWEQASRRAAGKRRTGGRKSCRSSRTGRFVRC